MKSLAVTLLGILLPFLALAGMFWDKANNPVSKTQASIAISSSLSATEPQVLQGPEQQEKQSYNNGGENSEVIPQQQTEESQKLQEKAPLEAIQDVLTSNGSWETFIANYYTKPATLPTPTYFTSSSSLFLRGIRSPSLLPIRNWQVPFKDIDGLAVLAM